MEISLSSFYGGYNPSSKAHPNESVRNALAEPGDNDPHSDHRDQWERPRARSPAPPRISSTWSRVAR